MKRYFTDTGCEQQVDLIQDRYSGDLDTDMLVLLKKFILVEILNLRPVRVQLQYDKIRHPGEMPVN